MGIGFENDPALALPGSGLIGEFGKEALCLLLDFELTFGLIKPSLTHPIQARVLGESPNILDAVPSVRTSLVFDGDKNRCRRAT